MLLESCLRARNLILGNCKPLQYRATSQPSVRNSDFSAKRVSKSHSLVLVCDLANNEFCGDLKLGVTLTGPFGGSKSKLESRKFEKTFHYLHKLFMAFALLIVALILTPQASMAASAMTAPVPTITGTALVDETLTANPGTWNPADATLNYQWFRDGELISGANTTQRR